MNNIYKNMIEDSPIAHLHIKLTEDENGNYTDLKVLDYNKSYERTFLIENCIDVSDINNLPKTDTEMNSWKETFKKVKEMGRYTCKRYIKCMNMIFSIDIYQGEENEFHFRFNRVSDQNAKLSSIIRKSPFMGWIKDRNGIYLDVNDKYLEWIDRKYEDIIGKSDYEIWEKDLADNFSKQDEEVISANRIFNYEEAHRSLKNDKELVYYETFKWPYTNKADSVVLGTIGICFDKTEEIALKKQLELNEKRFLEIANNLQDIIMIIDEKKAEYINPAFEKVYGFKPNELYEDISKWYDYWDEVEFEEKPYEYNYDKKVENTFRISKKGQEDKWIWSRFVPIIDENGNLIKKIGILSDITSNKKMQIELDRMKLDFFANLSHELRTPINLILSSLQVLYLKMDKLDNDNFEYFDKYLSIIAQNGRRLLKLVNNLIDTTKLDSGCFDYNPKNKDIISCIENICMSISEFVNSNGMQIIFDTDVEEQIVGFDQDHMERIILNLISNAIKFNKENGEIFVNIECGEYIKVSVKDVGIGIPEEKLETVFGRFEQVKSKFKKEREGSGIGLSLVKSLVEMHKGTIHVESILNEGSEFIIHLPNTLVEDNENDILENTSYLSNVNLMEVEFSDIYM